MKRNLINANIPEGAEFFSTNPSGEFINQFYKFITTKRSDGTEATVLCYYSVFNEWSASFRNDQNPKNLTEGLTKIID